MKKPARPENLHVKCSAAERNMAEVLASKDEKSLSDLVRGLIRREYQKIEQATAESAR